MKKDIREKQWQTELLFLNIWEKMSRSFWIMWLLIINVILINNELIKGEEFGIGSRVFQFLSLISIVIFAFWFNKSRKFKLIQICLSNDDFGILVKSAALDLDWTIEKLSSTHAICRQKNNWFWDGFRITILRRKNMIAFNSIVEPTFRSQPFSGTINKRNFKIFRQNLFDQNKEIDILGRSKNKQRQIELDYLADNAWSFKNTFRRIVIYTLCSIFLVIGIMLTLHKNAAGIILIVMSVRYIILDFKALNQKVRLLKNLKKTEPNNGEHEEPL